MRKCRGCGCDISDRPPKHFLCLRCYGDTARKLSTGHVVSCEPQILTPSRCDQLIKILNDKHHDIVECRVWLEEAKRVL